MRLQTVYLSYTDLTPGLENNFCDISHQSLIKPLRKRFITWKGFFQKYGHEFSLGFFVSTKKDTEKIVVLGPSISKKKNIADYSIFLPDEIKDLNHYIDLVFYGIQQVLAKYNVSESEILEMKAECKKELNLI